MMKIIGIVGGVGPLAGVDLHSKIIQNTKASKDQEHLSVVHMSFSQEIMDRSAFLLEPELHENPALAVVQIIDRLYAAGARIIGIPCNTFHAKPIWNRVEQEINKLYGPELQLLHLIAETSALLKAEGFTKVGLLATIGTYQTALYSDICAQDGIDVITPASPEQRKRVHSSIYHPTLGIKAQAIDQNSNSFARDILIAEGQALIKQGAECIIMGCTEIPLVLKPSDLQIPLQDPAAILARALIRAALATA